jgi:hypothetical protein
MKLILAILTVSGAAIADDARPAKAGVRVGASHRVDVIAPGERVETVIDRMRHSTPINAAPDARNQDRMVPRGDPLRNADRGPADGPRPAAAGAAPNQPPNPGSTQPRR